MYIHISSPFTTNNMISLSLSIYIYIYAYTYNIIHYNITSYDATYYKHKECNIAYRGAVPLIPMPMPKPVCITNLYNKIVQLEVCRTFSGRGMGINGTAHSIILLIIIM